MSKPCVYLFGPIAGQTYEQATAWREAATKQLAPTIECLSPMRGKDFLKGPKIINGAYPEHILASAPAIVARDLLDLDRSSLLLGFVPYEEALGVGSSIEIGYAVAKGKPIILCLDNPAAPLRQHPFIKALPRLVVVSELQEAIQLAQSMLNVKEAL